LPTFPTEHDVCPPYPRVEFGSRNTPLPRAIRAGSPIPDSLMLDDIEGLFPPLLALSKSWAEQGGRNIPRYPIKACYDSGNDMWIYSQTKSVLQTMTAHTFPNFLKWFPEARRPLS
jgi:hypothetical protein